VRTLDAPFPSVYFRRSIPKCILYMLHFQVRTLDTPFPNRMCFTTMLKKLTDKRLNESQRCEIISKLSKTNPPSKRALACEYDVSEGAIRKVWEKRDSILERSALLSEEAKQKTFRASFGRFTELEICCTSGLIACVVPGSLYRHLSPLRK